MAAEEDSKARNKFNTDLYGRSIVHFGNEGPYSQNLRIDALVVGAGFGKYSLLSRNVPFNIFRSP